MRFAEYALSLWQRVAPSLRGFSQHGGALLALSGLLVLWTGVFHSLAVERQQAIRAATDNAANLTRTFEEQVIRSIREIDQTLLYVRAARAKDPAAFRIYDWATAMRFLPDLTLQTSLIDRSGRIAGSSLFPDAPPVLLSDREYFTVHENTADDIIYISKPLIGRGTNKPVIVMSRRLSAPDGAFDGVVAVSLDAEYLSRFYNSVDLGARGVVTLVGTDGVVRARSSADHSGVGQSLIGGRVIDAYAAAATGTFESVSKVDSVRRIYAYRGVRSYPLIVMVGVAADEVLANYQVNQRSYLIVAAAITLLLLLVMAMIMRHQAGLRSTQQRLRASEAAYLQKSDLLEAALENMSQGIMMVDADRRIVVCNRRAIEKLGLPQALMASQPLFDAVIRWQWENGEYGEDGSDIEPVLRQQILSGGISDIEQTYERARPNGRILEVHSSPLHGGGVVRTFTDITDRKAAETVLRNARDEADRAARAKSEFLAMMSHEIRSPMNGMLGIIELLRDTRPESEQASMVELAHQSAKSLLRILDDVLDFSKIEAGRAGISAEPTMLRDLLRDLVETTALVAERKALRLLREIAEDVPDWIVVDPVRLRQILGNLLGNAIKFTAAGRIDLTVSRTVSPAGDGALVFAVGDSGIGMSADVLERLFQPFMQEDASTAKNFGGTGLGLSISRQLARMMGGDVTVVSTRGVGSVFTLTIPLTVATPPDAAADTGAEPHDENALLGVRVLAAEDQEINRWLLSRQFDRLGLAFTLVGDGHQALAALQAGSFDLLVTDCHMPGVDGMELASLIRAGEIRSGAARLPILGLTADITAETRARCLAAGMDDVVSKPINLRRLEQALRQIMAPREHGAGTASADRDIPADRLFHDSTYQELFGESRDDGEAWLAAYVEVATDMIRSVRDAVSSDNRGRLKAAAHQLAGSSLSVGAVRLGLLARALEGAAPDATAQQLVHRETGLLEAFDLTCDEISRFVAARSDLVS